MIIPKIIIFSQISLKKNKSRPLNTVLQPSEGQHCQYYSISEIKPKHFEWAFSFVNNNNCWFWMKKKFSISEKNIPVKQILFCITELIFKSRTKLKFNYIGFWRDRYCINWHTPVYKSAYISPCRRASKQPFSSAREVSSKVAFCLK